MGFRLYNTRDINHAEHRSLSLEARAIKQYLEANCDNAGIWEVDMDHLAFWAGQSFTLIQIAEMFENRIFIFSHEGSDYVLLKWFFKQQYANRKDSWNAKQAAVQRLEQLGVLSQVQLGDSQGQSETVHVNVYVSSSKEGGTGETNPPPAQPAFDLDAAFRLYPKYKGAPSPDRAKGLARLAGQIKTEDDYQAFLRAVKNYAAWVKKTDTYAKLFGTFVGTARSGYPWKDFAAMPEQATAPALKTEVPA